MAAAPSAIRPPLTYLVPSAWDARGRPNTAQLLTWVDQALSDGESYLQQQSSYNDIDLAIAAIRGQFSEKRPAKLSKLFLNKTKQYMREMIGILSNIRPMTDYRVESTDAVLQNTALQLNNLYRAWYLNGHIDDKIDGALQYAAIAKGYMEVTWDPPDDFDADADGDIGVHVRGPRDVYVIQPDEEHDLQKAYAVVIRKEIALNALRSQWPKRAAEITPDHETMTTGARSLATAIVRNFMSMFGPGSTNEKDPTPFPTCDVFYIYVRDDSLNETSEPIEMEPGKLWGYTVQPLTGEVWTGLYAMDADGHPQLDASGQPVKQTRPVRRSEAMLYPNRRLIICTRSIVFYDGPSYWWHGQVPLIPFDLDKWVFEWLGYSVVRDAQSANDSVNNIARGLDDLMNLRLRPSVMCNSDSASQSFLEDLDLRIPGKVYEVPMNTVETPLKLVLPYQLYDPPASALPYMELLMQQESDLMMLPQVKQMAQAKQVPSGDAIEKLQQISGPGMEKLSRRMEKSLHDLGEMVKWLFFEFYTAAKKAEVLGPDGVSPIDIDWDAGCMIPDLLDEYPEYAGPENRYRRARVWCKQFKFRITPNSMHNMTQSYRKQLYLLLLKAGFPMDPWTLAEALDLVNFGPPPKGTRTIMDRWMAWQDIQVKFKTILAAEMQQATGGAEGGGPGQGAGGGRPTEGNNPRPEMKDGGQRITQATTR